MRCHRLRLPAVLYGASQEVTHPQVRNNERRRRSHRGHSELHRGWKAAVLP